MQGVQLYLDFLQMGGVSFSRARPDFSTPGTLHAKPAPHPIVDRTTWDYPRRSVARPSHSAMHSAYARIPVFPVARGALSSTDDFSSFLLTSPLTVIH